MALSPEALAVVRALSLIYVVPCVIAGAVILLGAGASAIPAVIIAAVLGAVARCSIVLGGDGIVDRQLVLSGAAAGLGVVLAAVGAFVLLGIAGLIVSVVSAFVVALPVPSHEGWRPGHTDAPTVGDRT